MDSEYIIRSCKHYLKNILGKKDPAWPFYSFEHSINKETLKQYDAIKLWAEDHVVHKELHEKPELYEASEDPVVQQGFLLKKKVEAEFKNKYSSHTEIRLLIQVPDPKFSPGAYSAFSNFIEAFQHIGIATAELGWSDNTAAILESFKPTVLLATDHKDFLQKIDWEAIAKYRAHTPLSIGLIAHLEEYGNTPLMPRLDWAKEHKIDFYFSFRDKEYTHSRKEYKPFFNRGYEIFTLMFGANTFHYYPLPNIERDLHYSFIASTNWTKGPQYLSLAKKIVKNYSGFIDGVGWKHAKNFVFNKNRDRYIYARSETALNFHLPEQIEWACEVNERTHQLAACGVPQIVDNAKLLPKLYSKDAVCVARNGKEFYTYFQEIIKNPKFGEARALQAQKEVFEKHTTFHRAASFIEELKEFLKHNKS